MFVWLLHIRYLVVYKTLIKVWSIVTYITRIGVRQSNR